MYYAAIFTTVKLDKFLTKNVEIFLSLAQDIDCGYSFSRKSNVYSCKFYFYYIKVWSKGVFITWARYRDYL